MVFITLTVFNRGKNVTEKTTPENDISNTSIPENNIQQLPRYS